MAKMTPQREIEDNIRELERSHKRWKEIRENGCNDPFWADGVNMNLVRNHIFYHRKRIKEVCEENQLALPKIMKASIPPEVDNGYMAKASEIRENAPVVLAMLKNDENLAFISENAESITDKDTRQIAENALRRVARLEELVNSQEDLVEMRRYVQDMGAMEMESLRSCAERIRNLPEEAFERTQAVQLSLF